ncbi:hypothetical protein C5D25_07405 [Rathayibacter sp. AY1D7]|uniref:tyrosine-type recombinase/integrase n=1 Tax=Rathayibacter sp. AY1D7 TaxID=2080547 RepID=UPI000CE8E0A4|nr:site-specific integrase [Rathayibacter sp. AY1D7]PPH63125.1 hypothetical protein C5D25_07405 [Rathayibacter sp. AY1D7]
MARAWISDRWVHDHVVRDEAGAVVERRAPTSRQLQAIRRLPDEFRTPTFGRGMRWRVDWYETQPDGRQKQRSKSFAEKASAAEFVARIDHETREGSYRPAALGEQLFASVAQKWVDSKRKIKTSSRHAYERDLRTYVLPQWGGRRLASIKRHEVEEWVTALERGDAPAVFLDERDRSSLAAASVRRLHTVFSAVCGFAADQGWISTNPARGIELARASTHADDPVFLDFEEVEALAVAAEEASGRATDRVLVLTLAYVGLRINEALALRVGDFSRAEKRLRVDRTWTKGVQGERVLGLPKTSERRVVPVPAFLCDELADLGNERASEDWLFATSTGSSIHDANWRNRVWAKAMLGSGLDMPGLTPHKLRHTAASMAIAAGADPLLIASMLGHEDVRETFATYTHLWPNRLDEVTTAVERARQRALSSKQS